MTDGPAKPPSDHVAERVRYFREQLGWTAQRLAEECARSGAPELTASVIANIESGRRDKTTGRRRRAVTVDEWLAFSHALAVPPVLLLLPIGGHERVAITPTVPVPPGLAWRWIDGYEAPMEVDKSGQAYTLFDRLGTWRQFAYPLRLHQSLRQAYLSAGEAHQRWHAARRGGDDDGAQEAEAALVRALRVLARVANDMTASGLVPSPLPSDWLERMRELDLLERPDIVPDAGGPYLEDV